VVNIDGKIHGKIHYKIPGKIHYKIHGKIHGKQGQVAVVVVVPYSSEVLTAERLESRGVHLELCQGAPGPRG
jgi:hypothetical protein